MQIYARRNNVMQYLVAWLNDDDKVEHVWTQNERVFETLEEAQDFILGCLDEGDMCVEDKVGVFLLNKPIIPELGYKVDMKEKK